MEHSSDNKQTDNRDSQDTPRTNNRLIQDDRYMKRNKTTLSIQTWLSVALCIIAIGWGIIYSIIH